MTFFGGSNPINSGTSVVVTEVNGETGVVTLDIPSDDEITALAITAATQVQAAVTELGALAPAVNSLIAAGDNAVTAAMTTRPAQNVVFTDNVTLQQWRATVEAALVAAGSSAPVNTVQPTAATGTATVGSTQTSTTGTWTGTGGGTPYLYKWYQQDATTGVRTIIAGANASTYVAQASDYGYKLIHAVAGQAASGVTAAYVFATAPTSTIGTTLATNSGTVPAISGSAPAGSTLSLAMGVWTGATNGWSAQWYVGGSAYGSPTAISTSTPITFVTTDAMVGLAVSAVVYGYNSVNVPSAGVNATGPVTVTGTTPAVVNTAAPAWPATVYLAVQATLTPGTWTGTIDSTRVYDFYRNGTAPANLVRTGNTVALFTPQTSEGVIVGDTLYMIEKVTETATGTVYSKVSLGKVVSATPATLAASTAQTGLSWIAGSAISAVIPVTATGGTSPYTYTVSPALPSGLTMAAATGQITGTPASAVGLTTYTVTVNDSAASTPATSTFTATVSASVTALTAATMPVYAIVTGGGGTYNRTADQTVSGVVRLGPVADPHGSGRTLDLHRIVGSLGTGTECRCELYWGDVLNFPSSTETWMAFAVERKSGETMSASSSDDTLLVFQTHTPMNGDTQPPIGLFYKRQNNTVFWQRSWQTAAASFDGSVYTTSTQAVSVDHSETMPAAGVMVSYIVRYKSGWTAGMNPVLEVWRKQGASGSWEQIITNNTGFNEYNNPNLSYTRSYPRLGPYKWSSSYWNDTSLAFYMSPLYFEQGAGKYANAQQALLGL